ncbi:exo-alpha-sialidase [Galactobacter valiniphilus]|uniref:exo-alpha-sialidase n=1 Tax=Galactobacter valiniphilus TaxID=2676122 RepID=UPI0013143CB1|nr:exo-alpha-sialidase [Galactobacter valiniphilus]
MLTSSGRTSNVPTSARVDRSRPGRLGWRVVGTVGASLALAAVSLVPAQAAPSPVVEGSQPPVAASAASTQYNASWSLPSFYEETQLATNGQGGFPNYRIPALTVAPNGDLLASYDGRPTGGDAPGPNSILQRRSTDGGKSWGAQTVVAAGVTSAPKRGYSDPSYIVDRQTGEIFNFHVLSFDQGFFGSTAGTSLENRNVLHAALSRSTDNGVTWSGEVITDQITPQAGWISRFAASGQGIQLRYGPHAGRLVQQFTIRTSAGALQAVSVYSDDHGASWKAGTSVGTGMDENKTVELSDGTIMLNSRDSAGSKARKVAYSTDGGVSYGEVTLDRNLPDPTNNASVLRAFPDAPQGSAEAKVLLFSNAGSTSSRTNGTVRISFDDGKTWSGSRVFQTGGMAYSTLATLPDGSIGLLYEPDGGNGGIRFARFSLAWLGALPVTVTAEAAELELGTHGKAKGTATTDVTVTLSNVSSSALKLDRVALAAGPGWTGEDKGVGTLRPGQSKRVKLKLTSPRGLHAGDYIGLVTVTAGAESSTSKVALNLPATGEELVTVAAQAEGTGEVSVGDKVAVTYRVSNRSQATLALVPTGDLSGFSRPSAPNCGYSALAAGSSYTCTTAFHTVTAADLAAGGFTPSTSWELRVGGYSGTLIQTLRRNGPLVPLTEAR